MKNQRDKLRQYQRRITILTDKETDIAKQMLAKGDKKRALLALRRKKYQESLLVKTDAQLEQLEQLTSNVEFAQIQKDVVFGLQQGTKVLQEIHKEMGGIEHVEKLMGDTADAIAYQKVNTLIITRIGCTFELTTCAGSQRYARRSHLEPGRRGSRGRARGYGGRAAAHKGTDSAERTQLQAAATRTATRRGRGRACWEASNAGSIGTVHTRYTGSICFYRALAWHIDFLVLSFAVFLIKYHFLFKAALAVSFHSSVIYIFNPSNISSIFDNQPAHNGHGAMAVTAAKHGVMIQVVIPTSCQL